MSFMWLIKRRSRSWNCSIRCLINGRSIMKRSMLFALLRIHEDVERWPFWPDVCSCTKMSLSLLSNFVSLELFQLGLQRLSSFKSCFQPCTFLCYQRLLEHDLLQQLSITQHILRWIIISTFWVHINQLHRPTSLSICGKIYFRRIHNSWAFAERLNWTLLFVKQL